MKNKIDSLFSWQKIRKIAELKFVKTSYSWVFIVPIIVEVFKLVNEKEIQLTIFEYQFNITLGLPFTWQIFFSASVLFMIGYFIYLYKAPSIIKDHNSWSDFENSGQLLSHLHSYANEFGSWKGAIAKGANAEVDMRKSYWDIVNEANYKYIKSRWVCGFIFLLAFLLIAYLVFENIRTVVMFTINT